VGVESLRAEVFEVGYRYIVIDDELDDETAITNNIN
jgi:hypothetical protein